MELIIGKTAGFCFGVANAVNKTNKALEEYKEVYCLGELVHNKEVVNDLENKGLIIINKEAQAKKRVIIRAHGEKVSTYDKLKKAGIEIIDLTCPKVINIHRVAQEYAKKGYYIFLIGNSTHPETIATISYCGKNACIIEKEKDIKEALKRFYELDINKLLVLSQTTFSVEKFNNIVDIIKKEQEKSNIELEAKRTICDATRLRQKETEEISKKVDMMIIIGGKHSSNTNKLYEISKKNCKNSIIVETKKEINLTEVSKYQRIGIMAGASTPKNSIESVVEILNKL